MNKIFKGLAIAILTGTILFGGYKACNKIEEKYVARSVECYLSEYYPNFYQK